MPATLNCPNCGAAANDGATSCEYCGSGLVATACRSCFGAMFAGAQFCPHCGAMRHARLSDKAAIYECSGCGSAWLTPNMFNTLVADREARGATVQNGAA